MQIQVNHDNHIEGSQRLNNYIKELAVKNLNHYGEHITKVEVHLSDENAHKTGLNDKKSIIEVRIEGRQPIVVSHQSNSLDSSINKSFKKMKLTLDKIFAKLSDKTVNKKLVLGSL